MSLESLPQLGADGRILEGVVTTRNLDGTVNIAPMGPIVDSRFTVFVFRPFKTSTTYQNLVRIRSGVLHVTDDVMLIAAAAIGRPVDREFQSDNSLLLSDVCRAYEFEVTSIDDIEERTTIVSRVQKRHVFRDFFGFNRAQHAVIEAAILATRLHLLPHNEILDEMTRLQTIVAKTGAATEHRAFELLRQYVVESAGCEEHAER